MNFREQVFNIIKKGRASVPRAKYFLASMLELSSVAIPRQKMICKVLPLTLRDSADGVAEQDRLNHVIDLGKRECQREVRGRALAGTRFPHRDFRAYDDRLKCVLVMDGIPFYTGQLPNEPRHPNQLVDVPHEHQIHFSLERAVSQIVEGIALKRREPVNDLLVHSLTMMLDIYGPVVAVDPAVLAWNDGTVRRLADSLHLSRDWSLAAVLADAAEEAGLADQSALDHLRNPPCGRHDWLGCYAVQALRGKGI